MGMVTRRVNARLIVLSVTVLLAGLLIPVGAGAIVATSYPDPTADIPANAWSTLDDVREAFDNARTVENTQLGTTIPAFPATFPGDYAAKSPSEKALWLVNQEREARGLDPFIDVDPAVTQVAQEWAQHLSDTDAFDHRPDAKARIEEVCTGCVGHIGTFAAENLADRSAFSAPTRAILDEFGVESAIYRWMYEDSSDGWGHRHPLLSDVLSDDHDPVGSEGFIGIGVAKKDVETPCVPDPPDIPAEFCDDNPFFLGEREVVVWNSIDTDADYPTNGTVEPARIGDKVWDDLNGNGRRTAGEPGVAGVTVELLDGGVVVQTRMTNAIGGWRFFVDPTKDWQVRVTLPAGRTFTAQDVGTNERVDSDADTVTGIIDIPAAELTPGAIHTQFDAGLLSETSSARVGNKVWNDMNGNGIHDVGDVGVAGVTLELLDDGIVVQTRVTNANGGWSFFVDPTKDWKVRVILPPDTAFTLQGVGANTAVDSNADPATGIIDIPAAELSPAVFNMRFDAGLIEAPA